MGTTVDARGLSCPGPVLMTMEEIAKMGQGEILVLVDTDTSKENVSRAATSRGWQVKEILADGGGWYQMTIRKD